MVNTANPITPEELLSHSFAGLATSASTFTQRQQVKAWELRAVMSLCRLWQRQDKHKAAPRRLADIYEWFTEGFATRGLQEAKALLEVLS